MTAVAEVEQPSLLDLLPGAVEIIASAPAQPHTLWLDPQRGHVAIAIESRCGSNIGAQSAYVLANLGSSLRLSAYPHAADITPAQACELAAHLTAWADSAAPTHTTEGTPR